MFPKTGKTFQKAGVATISQLNYREAVCAALIDELGGSHRATKMTMKWTGVSDRTARNWISGENGPTGEHLIELIGNSDAVMSAVLTLAGRREMLAVARMSVIRKELVHMLHVIDTVCLEKG